MKVAIASDHGGFALKAVLIAALKEANVEVDDLGPSSSEAVDYPDYASRVTGAVVSGRATLGVLTCGTGIGMSIAANKVAGIRAALCHTELEARVCREHNDANVLCLGERIIGPGLGRVILEAFLAAKFQGGRHATRLGKITGA